jgi:DNA-binding CsgD family transcriptional regulator
VRGAATPTGAASAVTADELVGRDEELAAIDGFLSEGRQRVLVLEGPPGIGKTALWQAGVELARARGREILEARAVDTEVTLAFTGLGDLLHGVPEGLRDELPSPQRRALAVALAEDEDADGAVDGRTLGVALLNLLSTAAESSPVLVAVDDLQWLDPASGALVAFVARRLVGVDVRLLLSCRKQSGAALPLALERTLQDEELLRLSLEGLSEGAIRRLLRQRLGLSVSRSLLHAVHEATRGNPLFALELGRAGLERDAEGLIRLPGGLEAAVRTRLRTLPAAAREALAYVAAVGEPRTALLDSLDVLEPLEPAFEAGIVETSVDRVRFTHPLLAAGARLAVGARRRRAIHLALADAGEGLEQRARHLGLATSEPDASVAKLLGQAATAARARGAPTAAAELLERGLELTPADDLELWSRLATAAAKAHATLGDEGRLRMLVEAALSRLPPGPERAEIMLAGEEMQPGQAGLMRRAVEEAGNTDVGVRARMALAEQELAVCAWEEAVETATAAVELARSLGRRDLLAMALTRLAATRLVDTRPEGLADLEEALAIERELGGLPTTAYASPRACQELALNWTDRSDAARLLGEELVREARDAGDEVSLAQLLFTSTFIDLTLGELEQAWARLREGLETVERVDYEYARAAFAVAEAAVEARQGNLLRSLSLAEEALPVLEMHHDANLLVTAHASLLFSRLCTGEAAPALLHADAIAATLGGGRESWWSRHQGDEIEALVAAGKLGRSIERIEAVRRAGIELDLGRFLAWADRGDGLVALATGDLEKARSAFELALRHHEQVPIPFERARTLLHYGRVLRRLRKRRLARATLQAAREEFERLHAWGFAREAAEELRHVAGRAPGRQGVLTETEERVARLVADGLSNKEVAAQLFVTVSTIEATLTRVYAKLGIRSRAQLPRALEQPSPD